MGIPRFRAPGYCPKGKSKFEILLVKIFSPEQKTNQMLSATIEKIKYFVFKKTINGSIRQRKAMGKCKTKAIQADLGVFTFPHIEIYLQVFRHNQTYSGIIQAYSGIFRTLCNPSIIRTLAC